MASSSSPRMRMKEERYRRQVETKRRILRVFLDDLKANPYSDGDQSPISVSCPKEKNNTNANSDVGHSNPNSNNNNNNKCKAKHFCTGNGNAYRAAYNDVCVDEALNGRELALNIYYADVAGVCAAIERRVLETSMYSAGAVPVPSEDVTVGASTTTTGKENSKANGNGKAKGKAKGKSKGKSKVRANDLAGMDMDMPMDISGFPCMADLDPSLFALPMGMSTNMPMPISVPDGIVAMPMPMAMPMAMSMSMAAMSMEGDMGMGMGVGMPFARDMMNENVVKLHMVRCTNERLSARKLSPLHICILGARLSQRVLDFPADVLTNYHAIAQLLLITGSDPNARDALGATPLMHALGYGSSEISRALVPLLISWGAAVNTLDRLGNSVLSVAIAAGDIAGYTLLCHGGASFTLGGEKCGEHYLKKSKRRQLLTTIRNEADKRRKISHTLCDYCMRAGATKKCGWCKRVSYCDRECQLLDWKRLHENSCKAWQRRLDPSHDDNNIN